MEILPFYKTLDFKNPAHIPKLHEAEHVYTVDILPFLMLTSVTTLIEEYFESFNEKEIALQCSKTTNKKSKYYKKSVDEILTMWDTNRQIGTIIHQQIENWFKDRSQFPTSERAMQAVLWAEANLPPYWEYYPELRIIAPPYRLAGTVDLLVHDTDKNEWFILDWKTNSKIVKTAWKNGTHNATKYLPDSNYWHYSLQLSLYRLFLETYYNIPIKHIGIVHILEEPDPTKMFDIDFYPVNFLKPNCIKILQDREFKLNNNLLEFKASPPIITSPWD